MSFTAAHRRLLPIIFTATALQLAGPGIAHASPGGHRPAPGKHVHHGQSLALPAATLSAVARGDADAPVVTAV